MIESSEQWKICIPRERRLDILRQYHDAPTAEHAGGSKDHRPYRRKILLARYVKRNRELRTQCRDCLAHKPSPQPPAGFLHATDVKRPWEHVTVALVGPLPRSRHGHTWLLVAQDRFSKRVELAPLHHRERSYRGNNRAHYHALRAAENLHLR